MKVKAGTNTKVDESTEQDTDAKVYTVNVKPDLTGITSITNGTGSDNKPKLTFGDSGITASNGTFTVAGADNSGVVINGAGSITGLTNRSWEIGQNATAGRAATEDQLKVISDATKTLQDTTAGLATKTDDLTTKTNDLTTKTNELAQKANTLNDNTLSFGSDGPNKSTAPQKLSKTDGLKFNIKGKSGGDITTSAENENIFIDLSAKAKGKITDLETKATTAAGDITKINQNIENLKNSITSANGDTSKLGKNTITLNGDSGTPTSVKLNNNGGIKFAVKGSGSVQTEAKGTDVTVKLTQDAEEKIKNALDKNLTNLSDNAKDKIKTVAKGTALSYKANSETAKTVTLETGLTFLDGTHTTATTEADGKVKIDLNADTQGKIGKIDGLETKANKTADDITKINGNIETINTKITNVTNTANNAADKDLSNLNQAGKDQITELAKSAARNSVKVEHEGSNVIVTADSTTNAGVTTYKVKVADALTGVKSITGLENKGWVVGETTATSGRAATEDQLAQVAAVVNTLKTNSDSNGTNKDLSNLSDSGRDVIKSTSAWKLKTGETTDAIKGGETVEFKHDGNITLSQENKAITIGLSKNFSADKLTIGNTIVQTGGVTVAGTTATTALGENGVTITPADNKKSAVTLNSSGLNNGNNVITNVASGGTTTTNAANIGDVQTIAGSMGWNLVRRDYEVSVDNKKTSTESKPIKITNDKTVVFEDGFYTNAKIDGADPNKAVISYDVILEQVVADTTQSGKVKTNGTNNASSKRGVTSAQTVADAINASGWNITSDLDGGTDATGHSQTTELINPGKTVTFKAGKNLQIKQAGTNFTYALNPSLEGLTKVEVKEGTNSVVLTPTASTITNGTSTTTTSAGETTIVSGNNKTIINKDGTSVTNGTTTTTVGNNGVTIKGNNETDTNKTISLTNGGLNMGGKTITNVGNATNDSDVVNKGQLDKTVQEAVKNAGESLIDKGLTFHAQSGNNITRKLGETLNIMGSGTGEDSNYSSENIRTVAKADGTIEIQMKKNLATENVNSDTINVGKKNTEGKTDGKDGSLTVNGKNGETVTINGKDGTIGANGKDGKGVSISGKDGSITAKGDSNSEVIIKDGTIGLKGKDGANGLTIRSDKGNKGLDGKDVTRIIYKDANDKDHQVATLNDGQKYSGDNYTAAKGKEAEKNVISKKLNERLEIVGGATANSFTATDNIGVNVVDNKIKVQLTKNVNLGSDGSVTAGYTVVNNSGVTIKNGEPTTVTTTIGADGITITTPKAGDKQENNIKLSSSGLNMGGQTISNVKDGENKTDVATKGQLDTAIESVKSGLTDKGLIFGTQSQNTITRKLGETLKIVGSGEGQDDDYSSTNIRTITKDDGTIEIRMKKNLATENVNSDTINVGKKNTEGKTDGKDGSLTVNGKNGETVTINGKDGTIGANGKDGKEVSISGKDGSITAKGDSNSEVIIKDGTIGLKGKDGKNGLTISGGAGTDLANNAITRIEYKSGETTYKVATLNDGLKFTGNNNGDVINYALNSLVTIKGEGISAEASKTFASATGNINVKADKENNLLEVQLAKKIDLTDAGSVTIGKTVVNKDGLTAESDKTKTVVNGNGITITTPAAADAPAGTTSSSISLTKDGLDMGGKKISNVADATEDGDVMNQGQVTTAINTAVTDLTNKGLKFAANSGTATTKKLGDTVKIIGGGTENDDQYSADNIKTIVNNDGDIEIRMKKQLNSESINSNTITAGQANDKDGKNGVDGKVVVNGSNGNTITLDGRDGTIGAKGKDGKEVVINGTDGSITSKGANKSEVTIKDGTIGLKGKDGANGLTIKGEKGAAGLDGTDGNNGKDGMTRIVYQDANKKDHTVATMEDGLKFQGNNTDKTNSQKLNTTVTIKGETDENASKTFNSAANNIRVEADGQTTLTVKLSKDINLTDKGSLTAGNTKVDNSGLTTKNGSTTTVINGDGISITTAADKTTGAKENTVKLTKDGLDMGGKTITNVGDAKTDKDLMNKGQITKAIDDKVTELTNKGLSFTAQSGDKVDRALGESLAIEGEGTAPDDQYSGENIRTFANNGKIIIRMKKNIDTDTITVGKNNDVQGKNGADGKLTVKGKEGSTIVLDGEKNTLGATSKDGKTTVVMDGNKGTIGAKGADGHSVEINGNTGVITANGKDGAGVTVNGNDGSISLKGNQGETITIRADGGSNKSGDATVSGDQITRMTYTTKNAKNEDQTIKLATMEDGLKFAGDSGNTISRKLNEQLDIKGGATDLSDNNIGVVSDGKALTVKLAKNIKGVESISKGEGKGGIILKDDGVGIDGGNLDMNKHSITNVKGGRVAADSNDVVTGHQLHATNQVLLNNTQNIVRLDNKINQVDRSLRAGIAGAYAAAGLSQATAPGESVVSTGIGTFKGQNAIAVGYSKVSDSGRVLIRFSMSGTSQGDKGGSASIGYKF